MLIGTALFLLLTILAVCTQNTVLWGMALLCIGSLYIVYRNKAAAPSVTLVMGIYAVVWGLLTWAVPVVSSDYAGWVLPEGFGGLLLGLGIYQGFVKALLCRERVIAIYMRAKSHRSVGRGITVTYYEPVFAYRYRNVSYENSVGEVYSRRRLMREYREGCDYPIYLNPKSPGMICTRRRPQGADILLICIGIVCMGAPVLAAL